jgi:hypothetical protein
MMLFAFAALLQAAQPAQPAQPAAPGAPVPAWRAAGHIWGQCVKGRIDARLQSADAPEALTDAAIAGCASQLEAVRTAIAAERGDADAAANVERVRNGGRAMFLAYIARARGQAPAGGPAPAPAPGH